MQVIFKYPDGRTGLTDEAGFAAYHEEFGAELTAYVDVNGGSHPVTEAGKEAAEAVVPANAMTAYAQQVEVQQARESARLSKDGPSADSLEAMAEAARAAADAEAKAAAEAAKAAEEEAARLAAEEAEKPAKGSKAK